MPKITIDVSKMTPEDAFQLGVIFAAQKEVILETQIASKSSKPRVQNRGGKSNKFKEGTTVPEFLIKEIVEERKTGKTLEQLAKIFNDRGRRTPTGRLWNGTSIWAVVYSKNALKYWGTN